MKHFLKKHWATTFLLGSISMYAQAQTKLTFAYDAAGNQIERKFTTTASKNLSTKEEEAITSEEQAIDLDNSDLANYITIYPNPTRGKVRIEWNPLIADSVKEISITDAGALFTLYPVMDKHLNYVDVDLTNYASGLYLIHFIFDDRNLVVKKIIKN